VRIAGARPNGIRHEADAVSVFCPDASPGGKAATAQGKGPDGNEGDSRDHRPMSATPDLHHPPAEASGEQFFFVIALAFAVLVGCIVLGFFLPVGAGVALGIGVLLIVVALVGLYLHRLLSDA
jgi:hypothetical protein